MRTICVTGGYGFIGSHFLKLLRAKEPDARIIVIDSITYAARPGFAIRHCPDHKIESVCITDQLDVARVFDRYKPDLIFHFAAETHVCRSIRGPKDFVMSNVVGSWNLLEEWRVLHGCDPTKLFIHVSTDEVFGDLGPNDPAFDERSPLAPTSPYAATKASSDLLAMAYHHTYGLPVVVTNCTNNFGENQHQEKLIPATIVRFKEGYPARLYKPGTQVRDWLYCGDHVEAIYFLARYCTKNAVSGRRFLIGGNNELTNCELVETIHRLYNELTGSKNDLEIEYRDDRPTDDKRYAVNTERIEKLGININADHFEDHLRRTITYYLENT